MRYNKIRKMDISNGEGIGVSLFVQGCHFHCKNCFNTNTWDFNGGKLWTDDTEKDFLELISNDHISRVTILGGEPLEKCNFYDLNKLIFNIRNKYPSKKIWIYSGYTFESIFEYSNITDENITRQSIVSMCDILVDGQYQYELNDMTLKWRGSSNQRVIDIHKTLENNEIKLYTNNNN